LTKRKAGTAEKAASTKKTKDRSELVSKAIDTFGSKLDKPELKATVADLVRLLQLEKEMEETKEQPTEIRVTWIEPKQPESDSAE
jgi:hypothetical protein